jgi:protein gp37
MAQGTAIEWTDATWNPVHGCSKVSPGCAHCYAETLSLRFGHTTRPWLPAHADVNVQLKPERLDQPLRWRTPRMVFVNSMSDLFHEVVSDAFVDRVFDTMAAAPQHTFQVLTKRPERMRDYMQRRTAQGDDVLGNVWLGVSIENRRVISRADVLRETPAAIRFISAEPLLGPLLPVGAMGDYWGHPYHRVISDAALSLDGIDWLIVGGESGARHRPIDPNWVRDLRAEAQRTGTTFFFKQWGGRTPKANGRHLDGRTWDEMPAVRSVAAVG